MYGRDCGPYQSATINRRLFPKASEKPLPEGDGQGSGELQGKRKTWIFWLTSCFPSTHNLKQAPINSTKGSLIFFTSQPEPGEALRGTVLSVALRNSSEAWHEVHSQNASASASDVKRGQRCRSASDLSYMPNTTAGKEDYTASAALPKTNSSSMRCKVPQGSC